MSYLKYAIQELCELNFDPIDEVLNNARRAHLNLIQHLDQIKPDKNSPDFDDYCDYVAAEIDKEDVNKRAAVQLSIVGLYLTLEIGMTKLITLCFDDITPSKLRSYDNFSKELRNKGIDINSLPGNDSINVLREINNAIKHSESIESSRIDKIRSFVIFDSSYREYKLESIKLEAEYFNFKSSALAFFNALRSECTNKLTNTNDEIVPSQ
jgi:hypothetical protein